MQYTKTRFALVALFYSNGSEVIEVVIDGRFLETWVQTPMAPLAGTVSIVAELKHIATDGEAAPCLASRHNL